LLRAVALEAGGFQDGLDVAREVDGIGPLLLGGEPESEENQNRKRALHPSPVEVNRPAPISIMGGAPRKFHRKAGREESPAPATPAPEIRPPPGAGARRAAPSRPAARA